MLGWLGNLFIVAGLWGVGNKNRGAFILSVVGESLWVANALSKTPVDWALASICVVFGGMAVRSWVKWG